MNGNDCIIYFEKQWESLYTDFYEEEPFDYDEALGEYETAPDFRQFVEESLSVAIDGERAKEDSLLN